MNVRRFHRSLGLVLVLFIMNAAVTGILRAHARQWYWKDRLPRASQPALAAPPVGPQGVMTTVKDRFPGTIVTRMALGTLVGRGVYLVEGKQGQRPKILVDAVSGEVIERIDDRTALAIGAAYVAEGQYTLAIEPLAAFKTRKDATSRPAYRIAWDDSDRTEVFVDSQTGEVLQVLDRGRRFGLWVNRLHELNFGGLHRVAVTVLGGLIIVLCVAGIVTARPLDARKRRMS